MALPVTNLAASWVPNVGVQLSWTAAEDATTSSSYEIYVYRNSPSVSQPGRMAFVEYSAVMPSITKTVNSATYSLVAPATNALFSWAALLALGSNGNPPAAATFQVVHTDSEDNESEPLSITAYPPQQIEYLGIPHMPNFINVDPVYGQFPVNSQNSYQEISDAVSNIVGTVPGQRSLAPYFGVEDLPFEQINTTAISRVINSWEPRANAQVTVAYDRYNNAKLNVKITNDYGDAL